MSMFTLAISYLITSNFILREGNGTTLQYSCLENPMDRGACGLQSMGLLRVGHNWATSLSLFTLMHWRRKWQPTPVFLPIHLHTTTESESERPLVMSDSLWPCGLYSPWNSPGHNTAMASLSLLQGIFPTQRLNPGLRPCRRILYQLSHKGSLCYTWGSRMLENSECR